MDKSVLWLRENRSWWFLSFFYFEGAIGEHVPQLLLIYWPLLKPSKKTKSDVLSYNHHYDHTIITIIMLAWLVITMIIIIMIIIISFSLDCRMIFWHTSWNVCRTPLPVWKSTYYILQLILYFASDRIFCSILYIGMFAGFHWPSVICKLYCLFISYLHLVLYFEFDIVSYSIFSIICNWESMMTNCYHLNKMMMNDYCSPMQVAPFTLPSASLNPWKRKTTASNGVSF